MSDEMTRATITVQPEWRLGRQNPASRWHWFVDHPSYAKARHGYVPWRWLAVALAERVARRRDRQWARHLRDSAREIGHQTIKETR